MGLLWIVLCIGIYRYGWRWDWFPAVCGGALTAFCALMLVKGIDAFILAHGLTVPW
jgi:hypothetical protein